MKTTGWTFDGQWNSSKALNPCTLLSSSHPSRIRLYPITPGSWVLCWGSKRVLGSFTIRNPTCGILKPRIVMSSLKYFETSITSLLVADNRNNKCASVNSPMKPFNKGRIFFRKYPLYIKVTIDPESSKDGTYWHRMSIETDGHCDMW